jgi:hypothetical protein
MRNIWALLLALFVLAAQPVTGKPVGEGASDHGKAVSEAEFRPHTPGGSSVGIGPARIARGVGDYGPFRVLEASSAALIGVTDARSPAAFSAMVRDHPGINLIEMINCPGTEDDRANLILGRMIRARGIGTHVPDGGSVRSGAVDLFLAGAHRWADPGAIFAVHAWQDTAGLQPQDYPADAPKNRAYLDYYEAMGMTPDQAAAFYAMTNSVPFNGVRWLTAAELGHFVQFNKPA